MKYNNENDKHLCLNSQGITDMPLINIMSLDLSNNQIAFIPQQISQMTALTSLNLNHNLLTKFTAYIPNLLELMIANNQIATFDISKLKLTTLNIANNQFHTYHHLDTLSTLTLSWLQYIDYPTTQTNLNQNIIGIKLNQAKSLTFVQFIELFTTFKNNIIIKAIHQQDVGALSSIPEHMLTCLQSPQPLFIAAKINPQLLSQLLMQIPHKLRLLQVLLCWAVNKLDVELVTILLEQGILAIWDDKFTLISQMVGINIKYINGDSLMHMLLRRHCTTEIDYQNQAELIPLIAKYQSPNLRNSAKWYPIHYVLQLPQIRTLQLAIGHCDFTKQGGPCKNTLLHQAAEIGYLKAIQFLEGHVNVFQVNSLNKLPRQLNSTSLSVIKQFRRSELNEICRNFNQKYLNLLVSSRANTDFHIHITQEEDLYEMILTKEYPLQDNLIIVMLLTLIQFRNLHQVKFVSDRVIQPISYINKCFTNYKPDMNKFNKKLTNIVALNRQNISQQPIVDLQQQKQIHSKNLIADIHPIPNNNDKIFDITMLYSSMGISTGQSNRTTLLEYEDFQQRAFRSMQFNRMPNKSYRSKQQVAPIPQSYRYQHYITYRMSKSISDPEECMIQQINNTTRGQFIL